MNTSSSRAFTSNYRNVVWGLLVLLALLLCACSDSNTGTATTSPTAQPTATKASSQPTTPVTTPTASGASSGVTSTTTGSTPTVIIKASNTGNAVNISPSQDGSVHVTTLSGPVTPSQSGNTYTYDFTNSGDAQISVKVPATTNIQVFTGDGAINVDDITGQLTLQTNTGAINAVRITPQGNSTIKTITGAIRFSPASNAKFHLDATTHFGTITSNLPGVNVTQNITGGSDAHGDVGSSPQVKLTMTVDSTGTIQID